MKPIRRTLVANIMAAGFIFAECAGAQGLPPLPPEPPVAPRAPVAPEPSPRPLPAGMAFLPQAESREMRDRMREMADRNRDMADRNNEQYREAISAIDEHKYDRAIERLDRVIAAKTSRADGAYYWKAYALNKLGKRDEALASVGEIPKQFPQSRWINDAKALEQEIRQESGQGVSPESQSDEDLKLLAINAVMNSEPERAIPLLEKVINDPKNSLGLKRRALFVLAQSRGDRAREIVAQYAKSGSNPDLQMSAVQYLGTYRSQDTQQTLAAVYASVNDVDVKRAVLRGMVTSRDTAHLFSLAKSETNPDLRREAIRDLGILQGVNELGQLYAAESTADLKGAILEGLMIGRASDKLIEIVKAEKDPALRAKAIQYVGAMRTEKGAEALRSMYAGESDKTVKVQIINALWMDGACKPLVDVTRGEKDTALKTEGVRRLGMMKGCKEATDYLVELIGK